MPSTTNFRCCNATLQCSLKRGRTPRQCSYRAKEGSEFCGRHHNFVGQLWSVASAASATPPPPPPPPMTPPPDDTDCSICMDEISTGTPFTLTPCKHYYHTECLNRWKYRSNRCPCCRASLTTGENQTERDRQIATHNYIPPDLTTSMFNFTPFSPRATSSNVPTPPPSRSRPHWNTRPQAARYPPQLYPPSRRFELDINQVRLMRDTVERGSYEHGYYSAMYQSMLVEARVH